MVAEMAAAVSLLVSSSLHHQPLTGDPQRPEHLLPSRHFRHRSPKPLQRCLFGVDDAIIAFSITKSFTCKTLSSSVEFELHPAAIGSPFGSHKSILILPLFIVVYWLVAVTQAFASRLHR